MLKAAVVGGPSLVFTRKHVAGETKTRSHQYEDAKPAKRILGYDVNSLYPSTMMEMPCGEGVVTTYYNPEAAARVFPALLREGKWFGFAEVAIEVPEELWSEFEEFLPLFINRSMPDNLVPQHMHDYLKESGRKCFPDQKKLLGVLSAKKILLYTPLLRWYVNNGLEITAVYPTINYQPRKIYEWFVKEVADNRRKGDADKEKALLAEVFKLLSNSAYGKFIEGVEQQKRTLYTRDEDEVDKHLRSACFDDLEEIGDAYKIEMRKSERVMQTRRRPYSRRCSNSWATVLTASSLKGWSSRREPCTHGMKMRWTNIFALPGLMTSKRLVTRTRSRCARAR